MAAAVPAAISIGSSIYGHYKNKNKGMGGAGGADVNALAREGLTTARQARDQGASIFSSGAPLLRAAAGYYQKLLGGDANAMNQAVAPQAQAVNENYRGVREGIKYGPLRGGARDVALADTERQRGGALGMLVPNAVNQAAASGGQLALGATGQGANATANSGSLFNQLTGDAQHRYEYQDQSREKLGDQIGTMLTNLLQTYYTGRRGAGEGGGGGVPSVGGGGGGNMVPGTSLPGASFAGIRF